MADTKTHVIMDVRSDVRSTGTNNKWTIHSKKAVEFRKQGQKQYSVRFENVILPTSFYQVDSNFNSFTVIEDTGAVQDTVTITVTQSNYTVTELIAEVETKLNTATQQSNVYDITFDDKTGKITITYSGGSSTDVEVQSFNDGSTLNPFLGFGEVASDTTTSLGAGAGVESPDSVNMTLRDYITIRSNLSSHNHLDRDGTIPVGVRVPIDQERGDKIHFSNHQGYVVRYTSSSSKSNFKFECYDPYGNIVDFLGVPISFQLVFYELVE